MGIQSCTTALCLFLCITTPVAHAEQVRFAAIGDTPYYASETELENLTDAFAAMSLEQIPFIVHIGDIFRGHAKCTAERYRLRADVFAKSPMPFLITLGDNEFNDCANTDEARTLFRQIILGNPEENQIVTGTDTRFEPIRITRQKTMIENIRWRVHNVEFLMLTLPNLPGDYPLSIHKIKTLLDANMAFLTQRFSPTHKHNHQAMVIMMHSDPADCTVKGCPEFNQHLRQYVSEFDKPVLLINGSDHSPIFEEAGYQGLTNWAHLRPGDAPEERWPEVSFSPQQQKFFVKWHETL